MASRIASRRRSRRTPRSASRRASASEIRLGRVPRVNVRLHGVFSDFAGARSATVDASTVGAAIDALGRRFPSLRERLRDEHGRLREHIGVFARGEEIQHAGGGSQAGGGGGTGANVPAVLGGG